MKRRTLLKSTGFALGGLALAPFVTAKTVVTSEDGLDALINHVPTPSEANPLLLNFNENSLGLSPKSKAAIIKALPEQFRYPDAARSALIKQLATHFAISEEHITLGNGSSESLQAAVLYGIDKAIQAGKAVQFITPDPTFNSAELYAQAGHANIVKVPLTETLTFDLPKMQQLVKEFNGFSIVYLCNPNNPTATITPASLINPWITSSDKDNTLFILDEAYAEFVTDPNFSSGIELVKAGNNHVIVARTFSKLYALAGLRIGYAIATPQTNKVLENFLAIDNTNGMAAVAAKAALEDSAYIALSKAMIETSRQIVTQALDELKLDYLPSQANFIFHKVNGDVKTYQQNMKKQHVFVGREFPPAHGWNRLTLGTPGEMLAFVNALKALKAQGLI